MRGIRCLLLPALLPLAAMAIAEPVFRDCRLRTPDTLLEMQAECSELSVPLDHSGDATQTLSLRVARVSASRPREQVEDPLYFLAGGPGQAATETWPLLATSMRGIARHRDVILIDQRGTGGSNRLDCPDDETADDWVTHFDAELVREQARQCLEGLGADPRLFSSAQAAEDIEAVRRALGHGPINLYGVSYGTRLAQVYLRRHPDSVRRLVLDGVVPPTLLLGTEHAPNLDAAIERVLARCVEDDACRERFGDPRVLLQRLREQVAADAPMLRLRLPRSGEFTDIQLTEDALAASLRVLSYAGETQALVPLVLQAAAARDWQPLLTQALLLMEGLQTQIARGLELAVICSEDVPFFPEPLDQSATLLGNLVVDALRAQCGDWPAAAIDAGFHEPKRFELPALLLSGAYDPVTPPAYGEETLAQFPQGAHWVVPGGAHGVIRHGCTAALVGRFLDGEDPRSMNNDCLSTLRPPPFFVDLTGPLP